MRQRPRGRLTLPFVKASPEAQLRLLELADLDTELGRLDHRRRTLPENAELAQLGERAAKVRDAMTIADTNLADLDRDLARAEKDVEQVTGPHRAGQPAARRGPGVERARARVAAVRGHLAAQAPGRPGRGRARADGAPRDARRRCATARAPRRRPSAPTRPRRPRAATRPWPRSTSRRPRPPPPAPRSSPTCPADLLALYDKIRASSGGLGAAPLRRGQCGGCREMLSTVGAERGPRRRPRRGGPARGMPQDPGQDRRLRPVGRSRPGSANALPSRPSP